MVRGLRQATLVWLVLTFALSAATCASASQLIDRNAKGVTLQLNSKGEALLSYSAAGRVRHVLAWDAINAIPPRTGARQIEFQLDYTGGYGKYFKQNAAAQTLAARYRQIANSPGAERNAVVAKLRGVQQAADTYWQTGFHGGCGHYDGPALAWAVIACKASDGSYWAVQEWQRELPDYGITPSAQQAVWELRLSHWTGDLPVLTVHTDWSWHKYDHIWGTFTYLGQPVFGFHATSVGNPLDNFGRNVYIDTLNSAYGSGWRRENSALTHSKTGAFCYSVNEHPPHPAGRGSKYRITVIGPGVTPDVSWVGSSPGPFNETTDATANDQIDALGDAQCHGN